MSLLSRLRSTGGGRRLMAMRFSGGGHRWMSSGGGEDLGGDGGELNGEVNETARNLIEMAKDISDATTFGDRTEPLRFWHPVRFLIRAAHEGLDLPWAASIVGVTIGLRLIMIPANVISARFQERLRGVQPQINALQAEARENAMRGDRDKAMELSRKAQALVTGQGGLFKNLLVPLLQMPVFLAMYRCLTVMAAEEPSFATEKFLWLPSLAERDPTHLAPIGTALVTLAMMETQRSLSQANPNSRQNTFLKYFSRAMALFSIAFTWKMAGAIFFYWVPNAVFSVAIATFLRSSRMRAWLLKKEKRQETAALKVRDQLHMTPSHMGDLDAALSYVPKTRIQDGQNLETLHLLARRTKK